CVNRGCVPKKLMVYAAQLAYELQGAAGYGWRAGQPEFDWSSFRGALHRELERLRAYYEKILGESKVAIHRGRARLAGPHEVRIGAESVRARNLLLAVGGKPWKSTVPGSELCAVSDDVFLLERVPRRAVVLGSGYIGVEMACILRGLGAEITLAFRSEAVLPKFDPDVRSHLSAEMAKKGVRILSGTQPQGLERKGSSLVYHGRGVEPIECDFVLSALGRVPNTADLGLEEVGVHMDDAGAVQVDEDLRTSVPSIYAVGDCTGRVQLTPVAIAEGRALAETLFNANPTRVDYRFIPTAVFSLPPVGTVGLTEPEAAARGEVQVFRTSFRPMKHTLSGLDERVMLKLVVDRDSGKVVGCHMVAPEAPELAQLAAVALTAGVTKAEFDRTVALHPTLAEELLLLR
ncbi:MAG: FAD-dependent oxidoreductase, partial [Candidatus Eremiobacterota bacterium]